jgi:hypothetical protein
MMLSVALASYVESKDSIVEYLSALWRFLHPNQTRLHDAVRAFTH